MLSWKKSNIQPIGLDLGHDSIKLLQLEVVGEANAPAGRSLSVVAAAKHTIPEAAKKNPDRRAEACAGVVQRLLTQNPFVGRHVIATLPREIVHVKNLRLPPIPAGELESAVQFEARSAFPFDVDQSTIQFLPAGEIRQGNETRQEVIVLAAKQSDVDSYLEQLDKCGVIVDSLDTEITALFRSFERFIRRREDEQEVQVLVDIGVRRTQVIIAKGRDISFYKPVDIGGMHLLDAVSRKLGITIDEAKSLRQRLVDSENAGEKVESGRKDPVRQAVFDATRSVADELARELAMCLRYYSVTFRGHRPARLRLVGGEAADSQLQSIFNSILAIPVEAARPMFSIDTTKMRAVDRQGTMSQWALAMGLGMRFTSGYFAAKDGRKRVITATAGEETNATTTTLSIEPSQSPVAGVIRPDSLGDLEVPLREVEFLPSWYPKINRRKRAVIVQAWSTAVVFVVLMAVIFGKQWEVHRAQAAAADCTNQINQSQQQLKALNEELQYEVQLRQQDEIIAKLGLNVDSTRLINAIEDAMPAEMSLTGMTAETDEQPIVSSNTPRLKNEAAKEVQVDRRLRVHIDGICPTDVEVASLLAKLNRVKFFDDVAMSYARETVKNGRSMREFEASFSVNLNAQTEGK